MNALNNMSIKQKLFAAFFPVLLITIALGLFSVGRLSVVNDAAAEMRNHRLPAAEALGIMHAAVERLRANQNIMAGDVTAEMRKTVLGRADSQIKIFDEALAAYLPVVLPGEERALSDALVATWAKYKDGSAEFNRLLTDVGREKGFNYLMVDMQTSVDALRKALGDDKDYNRKAGRAAAEYGASLAESARFWILAAVGLSLVVCVAIALIMTRALSAPIVSLREAMGRLAKHDLKTEITGLGRQDEIGAMAEAVQVFKANMIEADRLGGLQHQAEAAKERRMKSLEDLTRSFETQIADLVGLLAKEADEMRVTAKSMSSTTQKTLEQSATVASAAEEASSNAQTVAAATNELTSSIQEISRQVADSAKFAGEAVTHAQRTDTTVQALADGAHRIGEVVTLIKDIASQTNLLALNATIEAARAGEAGKGFAVVASEVKSLANQTAKATEDISAQIESIQRVTADAVSAIRGIGATISQISHISDSIAAAVEEQGAATQEISRNVVQASAGTEAVTMNIQGVKQVAEESGAAAGQVLTAAGKLAERADQLKAQVNNFIQGVRGIE